MFFQFSPVKPKKAPAPVKKPQSEIVEVLTLAPFSPVPKLFFDKVKIGEWTTCKLLLRNPSKQDTTIILTSKIPQELNVTYSWESKTIERQSECLFEINWCPIAQESSYHKIRFADTENSILRDVPVVFKTKSPKKPAVKKRTSTIKKPVNKSPVKKIYTGRPLNISSKRYSFSPKNKTYTKTRQSPTKTQSEKKYYKNDSINLLTYVDNNHDVTDNFMDKLNAVRFDETFEELSKKSINISPSRNFCMDNSSNISPYNNKYNQYNNKNNVSDINDILINHEISQNFTAKLNNITGLDQTTPCRKRTPLTPHNEYDVSPNMSLGSYFRQKSEMPPSTPLNCDFDKNKLNLGSFFFKPNNQKENMLPISTPIFEKEKKYNVTFGMSPELTLLSDTYEIHNTSLESCGVADISGATYTKESAVQYLERLSGESIRNIKIFSPPLSSSPPASFWEETLNKPTFIGKHALSCIEEEEVPQERKKRKCDIDLTVNHAKTGGGFTGPKNWSQKGGVPYRIAKNSSGLKMTVTDNVQISNTDNSTVIIQNPFLLSYTNSIDPFMTRQLYSDQKWFDQQERNFKKWLNSLLTPPDELYLEEQTVDVAKVWMECKKREVNVAPTKEVISNKYHVNTRLTNLRKSAQTLFQLKDISTILTNVAHAIDTGKISIRPDKDVHLNISIKSELIGAILSYNPLWLRIGLETIYNEIIPLHSNSDIVGLSAFIVNRLFKDPYLLKKHKSMHAPKYAADFNKFFLKKLFSLVYFLDQAKNRKLIHHDPCLFNKSSTIKESKTILLMLSREVLSAMGDITKCLKYCGYVLSHSQTYIQEFDYAVKNLGVDLRDGIRLAKVMEIILMKADLTKNLRAPAISRLQKIHNMKLVFDSLEETGFKILYDILPKNIVNGHREKTMSFLWQIIHKFEAPLMVKSATTIQTWFRSLPVVLKRRTLERVRIQNDTAARKIQNWYKRLKFVRMLKQYIYIVKTEKAAIKIQSWYRMRIQQNKYRKQLNAIKNIQIIAKGWLIRNYYRQRIKSAILIQSYIRMFLVKRHYHKLKTAAIKIQSWYRCKKESRKYQMLKSATISIQRKRRAIVLARNQKVYFDNLKQAVIKVQRRFIANQLVKLERNNFKIMKTAVIKIQIWYRSIIIMRNYREQFLTQKKAVRTIEKRYVARKTMLETRQSYCELKRACLIIQQRYRAQKICIITRTSYLKLRETCIFIQQKYRANKLMKIQMVEYQLLRQASITLQKHFRSRREMKVTRNNFLLVKKSTIIIQTWFRSCLKMVKDRKYYLDLKYAVKICEERYKARLLMKKERQTYLIIRQSAVTIQSHYRALVAMRIFRNKFQKLKSVAILIQNRYRANKAMLLDRNKYLQMRNAAIKLQSWYRAQRCKRVFETVRNAVIVIQTRFKAFQLKKKTQYDYQQLLKYTTIVQRKFRANKLMIKEMDYYRKLKITTTLIQRKWRASILARNQRTYYLSLVKSAIIIQQRWKANRLLQIDQQRYQVLRSTVIYIQQKFRAKLIGKIERKKFLTLKYAAIKLQMYWRAKKLGEIQQKEFKTKKQAILIIQRSFRLNQLMKVDRNNYLKQKNAIIVIQRWYRSCLLTRKERNTYLQMKKTALEIQRFARGYLIRKKYSYYFTAEAKEERRIAKIQNQAAIAIQSYWRGYHTRRNGVRDLNKIREKLNKACKSATSKNTISSKCDTALQTIVHQKSTINQVITALEDIEYATRRCKNICIQLSELLPSLLYTLLNESKRSLPEMTACMFCTKILINFCKLDETKNLSYDPKAINNLLTMMVNWCDKESHLFPLICTLLWLFAHVAPWRRFIQNIPNIKMQLEKIKGLVDRKASMVMKQKTKVTVFKTYKTLPLPSLLPDWGLEYEHKPHAFSNSIHALDNLFIILNF